MWQSNLASCGLCPLTWVTRAVVCFFCLKQQNALGCPWRLALKLSAWTYLAHQKVLIAKWDAFQGDPLSFSFFLKHIHTNINKEAWGMLHGSLISYNTPMPYFLWWGLVIIGEALALESVLLRTSSSPQKKLCKILLCSYVHFHGRAREVNPGLLHPSLDILLDILHCTTLGTSLSRGTCFWAEASQLVGKHTFHLFLNNVILQMPAGPLKRT